MATPSRVTVTDAATQLLAASGGRRAYTILNRGTGNIYLGNSNVVTTATGILLQPGEQADGEADADAIWAIAEAANSEPIHILEVP